MKLFFAALLAVLLAVVGATGCASKKVIVKDCVKASNGLFICEES
jgi:hypothetical protein